MDNLIEHLGKNESITTFCIKVGGQCAPPYPSLLKFIHLLHLNQAGVQHLISDLTDAHAGTLYMFTRVRLMSGWMVAERMGLLS